MYQTHLQVLNAHQAHFTINLMQRVQMTASNVYLVSIVLLKDLSSQLEIVSKAFTVSLVQSPQLQVLRILIKLMDHVQLVIIAH